MISSVTSSTAPGTAASSKAESATDPAAAQDRFLKLLVAQLNNQDPMNPLDNAQMTSQIAQINTVTGIQQLNDTVKGMMNQFAAQQQVQALAQSDAAQAAALLNTQETPAWRALRSALLQQLETARTAAAGAGLGLSIVDKTVQRMGGHLTLQNAEGGGMEAQIHLRRASDLGQKTEQRLQRPAIKRQLPPGVEADIQK